MRVRVYGGVSIESIWKERESEGRRKKNMYHRPPQFASLLKSLNHLIEDGLDNVLLVK